MNHGIAIILLAVLTACAPADEEYCRSFGVAGTAEFSKCLNYYHQQSSIFGADRARCEMEADATYPPTLYDNGRTEHVMGGFSGGVYYGGATVFVEPDYRHNLEVDRLRMRVIGPCMQNLGWNSPDSWQAGKRPAVKLKPKAVAPQPKTLPAPLPWLF